MKLYSYLNLPDFKPLENERNSDLPSKYGAFGRGGINDSEGLLTDSSPSTVRIFSKEYNHIHYYNTPADKKYIKYMINLIPEIKNHIVDIRFQEIILKDNHPNGGIMLPHTDSVRKFVLAWNFTTGGSKVTTYFYQEEGQPLARDNIQLIGRTGQWRRKTYRRNFGNDLHEVDRVIWLPNTWCIFRSDVLHAIFPVFTSRKAFCVGLEGSENLFYEIMEKYGGS